MTEKINTYSENTKNEEKEENLQKMNNSFDAARYNGLDLKSNNNCDIQKRKSLEKGKNLGSFILGKKIGEGTFGIVRIATHILTGEKVAVKILDKEKINKESDKKRLEREIKILKLMHHNNIVHLYNVILTSTKIYLVMEHIDGKELFFYILHKKRLSELEACKFYQQLISCIEYLGKLKVSHRDLKPENLLLDKKKNIKLVDFGLSNMYENNELLSTACGSPSYAAPEMLSGKNYNGLNVDIWSSGIVLYAMICGYLPFEDKNNDNLYKKIKEGYFETPDFISDNAKDFLHRIINIDPDKRYSIEQIKSHPWFNIINPKIYMNEGLLITTFIVPIDEEIIHKMSSEYEYNSVEVRINLLANKHNHITTTYYLLLKKKIDKGKKSIGNTYSSDFKKYIHNPENLLSNYNGNWRRIFRDRALEKAKKIEENKEETKMDIESTNKLFNNNDKDEDNFYKNINSLLQQKIRAELNDNKIDNNQPIINKNEKEESNHKKSNENNYDDDKNKINNNKNNSQNKKLTIFDYLKKIKEIRDKKGYKKEKSSYLNFKQNNQTPKKEKNNQKEDIFQTENKNLNECQNKETNNKNSKNIYSNSLINQKLLDKEYKNQKIKSNNLFDINNYLKEIERRNKRNIKKNNFSINQNTYFNQNIFNDNDFKEIDKNNNNDLDKTNYINHFPTAFHESRDQVLLDSQKRKLKKKKFIRHKYVESRYFSSKGTNNPKTEIILNNSFRNINNYDNTNYSSQSKNNKKKIAKGQRNNRILNINYSHNKNSESSLSKRKKYSQTVKPKVKNIKKIKDDNKSSNIINKQNMLVYKKLENKENTTEIKNLKYNYIKLIGNRYKNLNNNDNLGINYIVQKRKARNELFNSKNNNKNKFFNDSISFEINTNNITIKKEDSTINNRDFKKRKYNINKLKDKNYINRNFNNSHRKSNTNESYTYTKIKEKDKIYKEQKRDFNSYKISYNCSKEKNNIFYNYTNNNTSKIIKNNKKQKIKFYKSDSNEKYKEKIKKKYYSKKLKFNSRNYAKSNTIYNSKETKNNINQTYTHQNKNSEINQNKFNYIPFNLNNIIVINNKNLFKQIINKELEDKKIKYSIKNNKYLCWKNDNKLTIEIKQIDEINNCYSINMKLINQKNNILNSSFCGDFFRNIVKNM